MTLNIVGLLNIMHVNSSAFWWQDSNLSKMYLDEGNFDQHLQIQIMNICLIRTINPAVSVFYTYTT